MNDTEAWRRDYAPPFDDAVGRRRSRAYFWIFTLSLIAWIALLSLIAFEVSKSTDVNQQPRSNPMRSNAAEKVTHLNGGDGGGDDTQTQEGVIQIDAVRDSISELEKLFTKAKAAKDALAEAITKVAEKSGLREDVLKSYVKARCNDRLDEYQTKAEQLSLLFTEIA